MTSDPKLQASYYIFLRGNGLRPGSPEYNEIIADIKAWARLADPDDLGLDEPEWALFSNGVGQAPAWLDGDQAPQIN